MDSGNALRPFAPQLFAFHLHLHHQCCRLRLWPAEQLQFSPLSTLKPRPRSRRKNKLRKLLTPHTRTLPGADSSSESKMQAVIDLHQLPSQASAFFHSLQRASRSQFHSFLSFGSDAVQDLQTLIDFDEGNRRVIFSCRPSTMHFLGYLVLCGFLLASAIRAFFGLFSRFRSQFRSHYKPVVRRDRSLGGKEVVVGTIVEENEKVRRKKKTLDVFGDLGPSVSVSRGTAGGVLHKYSKHRPRGEEKLPEWWPVPVSRPISTNDRHLYQREADRLLRAIADSRTRGEDITEDDIIQLRQICRTSGIQVSFETKNTRDSFYRASVEYVLNICSRTSNPSTNVRIGNEDARSFVAGLAWNIGLENVRAARIVSAAVAARTRSRFLQAWALEMQGRHSEAIAELSKMCLILRTFPPEEYSAEMELVALGLKKHLNVEQRECLMSMLAGVCDEKSRKSAAEALGLVLPPNGFGDLQHGNQQ